MDDNNSSPKRDPFELSDLNYLDSTADLSISQSDELEISTYGQLVNEIYKCGSTVLRYHGDYLKTRSSAPPEETPQYDFVSKGDYLCAGRDFTVFTGYLFKDYHSSPSFPQKKRSEREYGDRKFIKPWSGASASAGSFISLGRSPTRIAVALKESVQSIHQTDNRPLVLGTFLKEVRIMGEQRSCADIVNLLGVAFVEVGPEVKPTLVLDLALGNLIDFFRTKIVPEISWELKLRFALQIATALQALHTKGVVHADVKAQNVLVFPHEKTRFCAKLSDFGNSTVLGAKSPIAAGTRYYLAPECFSWEGGTEPQTQKYGNSEYRDIYAFGLLMWELATNCQHLPFWDITTPEKVVQMKSNSQGEAATYLLAQMPDDTPQYMKPVISDMLRADPTQRSPLSVVAAQLLNGIEQASTGVSVAASQTGDIQHQESQASAGTSDHTVNGEPLLQVPWSLQKHLYEESVDLSSFDSKVFLAYCYILCSDRHQNLREEALRLLRPLDPFQLAPGAKLTPFRAMMELQDWEGLSEILRGSKESSALEMADRCVQHIFSFGWRRFVTLACAAGAELSHDSATANALVSSSEKVAVASMHLLASASIVDVGQASWGNDGLSALHMAAVSGKPCAVSALLENGADPSARDKDNRTPLHLCCQAMTLSDNLSVKVTMSMIKNYPSTVNDVMQRTLYTPLRFAVEAEKPQLCRYLLQNGADVNARAAEGSTALHECAWSASEKGNGRREKGCKDEERALELAQVLLKYGEVDINLRSCHNSVTALGIAAVHGNFLKMVSLLLDHGADINTSVDALTALAAAVQHRNREMVSVLLERGANPNFSVQNVTALGLAVGLDQHETTPFLLEHGADPAIAHQGIPLVCWAIYACQNEGENKICPNLTLLLQRGADATAVAQPPERSLNSPSGWSAIHFAAYKLSTAALNVLLDHQATLSACTEDGETALHIAVSVREDSSRLLPMLKELVRHGIDLDATDVLGQTALHIASKLHRDDIREYLLEAGCNSAIHDSFGRTAQELYNLDETTMRREEHTKRRALEQRRNEPESSR